MHVSHYVGTAIDLPVVLTAALAAAGTTVEAFLVRLVRGAIWRDEAIRSDQRDVSIQAYLAREGLRCVIRIGNRCWYHHPADTLHIYGVSSPAIWDEGVSLSSIIGHVLLDDVQMRVLAIGDLNRTRPDLGLRVKLQVPRSRHHLPSRA